MENGRQPEKGFTFKFKASRARHNFIERIVEKRKQKIGVVTQFSLLDNVTSGSIKRCLFSA